MPDWKRTFWVVYVANVVTAIGMMSFLPFFRDYLPELGVHDPDAQKIWTGVIFGTAPLVAAFSGPIWGALGDRFGRKLMVIRAMIAIALFVGLMGLARSPWHLFFLRALQGTFSGFVAPSITLVSVAAPDERQGGVAGSLSSALAVGSIVGPIVGAVVQTQFGVRSIFLVVSVLALSSALLVAIVAREDPRSRQERAGAPAKRSAPFAPLALLRDSVGDLRELGRSPRLRVAVALLFCVYFGVGATNPLLEHFVAELWEGDPELVPALTAPLFTLLAVSNVLALPVWGRLSDRRGPRTALIGAAGLSSVALLLHALVPIYWVLWPARAVLGGVSCGSGPATFGIAAEETPVQRRGGAMGVVFSARALAVSLSAMLGGFLATLIGIRGLFAACSVLVFTAWLWGRKQALEAAPASSTAP